MQDSMPEPANAIHVGGWTMDHGNARHFAGTQRGLTTAVDISGEQFRDGRIDRCIWLAGDIDLDADGARAVAADLLAAADELDALSHD